MSGVQFEQPAPPIPRGAAARAEFASALRLCPGEWALLGQHPSSMAAARQDAYRVRNAQGPQNEAFAPAGSFETVARDLFGEHRVYVRFVGERS